MTSRDFVYWIQGFLEVGGPSEISKSQLDTIRRHLNMVFYHEIDPSFGDKDHQAKLQRIHDTIDKADAEKPKLKPPLDPGSRDLLIKC